METKASTDIEVIVTVSGDRLAETKAISERLQSRGLTVSNVLDRTGMIIGHCSGVIADQLKEENGVAAVEASGKVQLAPPRNEIQ